MLNPIITLFMHFPLRAITTVLLMLAISVYAYKRIKCRYDHGDISKPRGFVLWLLLNYVILLLFFTVFGRRSWDYYRYNFDPWYSYLDVLSTGDITVAFQIAVNIAAFIPLGSMSSLAAKRHGFLKGLLCGVAVSVCIEFLQLVLRSGYCEIDDLISNSLGTLIGCVLAGICILVRYCFGKHQTAKKRHDPDS